MSPLAIEGSEGGRGSVVDSGEATVATPRSRAVGRAWMGGSSGDGEELTRRRVAGRRLRPEDREERRRGRAEEEGTGHVALTWLHLRFILVSYDERGMQFAIFVWIVARVKSDWRQK
jgi:hypothetical protein